MKYKVTYAFDAPCYGSVDIEADSPEDAKARAVEMHKNDTLVREYEANRAVSQTTIESSTSKMTRAMRLLIGFLWKKEVDMSFDFNGQALLSALRDIEKIPVNSSIALGVCYEVFRRTKDNTMWSWVNERFKEEAVASTAFPEAGVFTEQRLEFVRKLIQEVEGILDEAQRNSD